MRVRARDQTREIKKTRCRETKMKVVGEVVDSRIDQLSMITLRYSTPRYIFLISNNVELVKVYHSYRIISRILFSLVQSCRKRVEGTEWNTKGKKENIMQSRFTYRVTLDPGSRFPVLVEYRTETKSLLRTRLFKISIKIEILAETARAVLFLIIK